MGEKVSRWQDWSAAGTRLLYVMGAALLIYLIRSESPNASFDDLLILAGVGGVLVAFLVASTWIPQTAELTPYMILAGDAVLAGVSVYVAESAPLVVILAIAYLGAAGFLRQNDVILGSFHAGAVLVAVLGVLIYQLSNNNTVDLNALLTEYDLFLLVGLVVVVGAGIWIYAYRQFGSAEALQIAKIAKQRERQLAEMRERARAITTMTNELTATLNFDQILIAALGVGELGLKQQSNQRIISMALLFRSDDSLYIASSRGLTQNEESRTVTLDGIIAQTLEECVPLIGKHGSKDPVLGQFASFKQMRSILCIPLRANYDNFGVLVYGSTEADAFDEDQIDALQAVGVQTTVALQNSVLYSNLLTEKERIIQMEEDARKSLVRDLHDVPTQTISAVAMHLRVAIRMLERSPNDLKTIRSELETIESMALRAAEEIRHVLFKLRPLALETQGLTVALEQLAEKMKSTYGQYMTVQIKPDVEQYLDDHKQGVLFYLIEEAVNNARKHAQAEEIKVRAARRDSTIVVRISDNGKGFDLQGTKASYDQRGSFGLVNMKERAELLEGTLKINSEPGKGTSIDVIIPIDLDQIPEHNDAASNHRLPITKLAVSARNNLSRQLRH
ncbi:MAG: GAF domain-containing sensor histidine kinase [Chloroflexi bacterium]|nr:MAG: GAF domain-containing sensor histidine kinase [Chloroflexota bacterium]